jgi:biotin transporter BioY
MFCQLVPIYQWSRGSQGTSTHFEGTSMGYLISFLLGIFVATVGVSGAASVLDKAVKTTQTYMQESVK